MKERLTSMLFVALALHLLLSLVFLLSPMSLINPRISKIYRTYLLSGSFFDADRIVESHTLYVSWKSGGQWSDPVSPAMDNFRGYNERFNPADIYRSRLERSLYQGLVLKPGRSVAD